MSFRFMSAAEIAFLPVPNAFAQPPSPPQAPSPSAPNPAAKASPTPTPTTEDLVNSLNAADLQAAITLLKGNFTNPDAITEAELNRATLEGLLVRLNHGLALLPDRAGAPAESPFYSELLEGHIGYLPLGSLTSANLQAMDKKLAEFTG